MRGRRVRRIVRHVSPWSVCKFSLLFYVSMWVVLIIAGVILWRVGSTAGIVGNVEKFWAKATGEKVFTIDGQAVFQSTTIIGGILVIAATGLSILAATLFNVISDLTGGIRVTVIELEAKPRRTRADRRPTAKAARVPTPGADTLRPVAVATPVAIEADTGTGNDVKVAMAAEPESELELIGDDDELELIGDPDEELIDLTQEAAGEALTAGQADDHDEPGGNEDEAQPESEERVSST